MKPIILFASTLIFVFSIAQAAPPDTPQNVSAKAVGATEVYIKWDTVDDAQGYRVYRGGALVCDTSATLCADDGLYPETGYNYWVVAFNSAGEVSPYSLSSSPVTGSVIEVPDCDQSSVQAAVNAADDGDTIQLPEGAAEWITITDSQPAIEIVNKAITLRGAGTHESIITAATDGGWANWGIHVNQTEDKPFRITNLTFTGSTQQYNAFIVVQGKSRWWRIDHLNVVDFSGASFFRVRRSTSYGVVDHCYFRHSLSDQPIQMFGENFLSWQVPLSLGTANALYIEDCLIESFGEQEPLTDGARGARFVVRFNEMLHSGLYHNHGADSGGSLHEGIVNRSLFEAVGLVYDDIAPRLVDKGYAYNDGSDVRVLLGFSKLDDEFKSWFGAYSEQHFNQIEEILYQAQGLARGTLSYEVYENKASNWMDSRFNMSGSRSGTGVIFNNIFEGNYRGTMFLNNYTSCTDTYDWPLCTEYPCQDQIGYAPDADGDGIQDLEPVYSWGNQVDSIGNDESFLCLQVNACDAMREHIVEGREYYNEMERPGYAPFTYPHPLTHPAPPEPPSQLEATAISGDRIRLAWDSYLNVEEGFRLERSSDGVTFNQVATVRHDENEYIDEELAPYTTYQYRMSAFNQVGDSGFSNITQATTHEICFNPPVAEFLFEGNADDSSGNGYQSDINGATATTGMHGQAFRFDGVDDYIVVTPTIGPIQGKEKSFSFSAWVQTDDATGNHWIFGDATTYVRFLFGLSNGRLALRYRDDQGIHNFITDTPIAGGFKHVVATYDVVDRGVRIYVDGQLVLEDLSEQPYGINDISHLQIGRGLSEDVPEYFNGIIDDVQSYDYPLNSAEVASIYSNGTIVIEDQAPTAPVNLSAEITAPVNYTLSWEPSDDNQGVAAYRIFRNGDDMPIAVTRELSYSDTEVTPGRNWVYTVTAMDAAGNESLHSNAARINADSELVYDLNFDSIVDELDVSRCVDIILGRQSGYGDVNDDGTVDIKDVIEIISMI